MKRVLVTHAGGRLGIGVSRALLAAPEQIDVIGVDASPYQIHRAVMEEKYLLPRAEEADYLNVLEHIITRTKPDFLWPNHESEIRVIAELGGSLPVVTFLPSSEAIEICQDKMKSYQLFQQAGLPVPESMLIHDVGSLREAFRRFNGKLWLRAVSGTGGKGSMPAEDVSKAKHWIDFHDGWGRFMAAERLGPQTVTWESIWNHGQLIAAQGRRRLYWEFSSLTLSGITGIAGAVEWVGDPLLDNVAVRAIHAVSDEPHGLFSVDITYDWNDHLRVTEINCGRFMSGGIVNGFTEEFNAPLLALKTALEGLMPIRGPLLNPLPSNQILLHGIDVEPVLVSRQEVDKLVMRLQAMRIGEGNGAQERAWSKTA